VKEPATLREAYDRYKSGTFLRKEMIGQLVTVIEEIQARIANIDEAAVADLSNRVGSLETVLGAALRQPPAFKPTPIVGMKRRGRPPRKAAEPSPPMNEMGV
jgi:hypothetical protein